MKNSCGVEANVLDSDIIGSEFKLYYAINFRTNTHGKSINTPYPPVWV